MKDGFTRILNAAAVGLRVMDEGNAVWSGKLAVVNLKNEMFQKFEAVELLEDALSEVSGETVAKRNARKAGARTAWKIARPMVSYAKDISDEVLKGEVDIVWSKLRYGKDQDIIDEWGRVERLALAHETALDSGGYVDVGLISQLQGELNLFKQLRGKPKAKVAENKAIHAEMAIKIREMREVRKHLLGVLVQFSDSDMAFYLAVKAAFKVSMVGIRHRAIRIQYLDDATGVRLRNVEAEMEETGMKKRSSRQGVVEFSRHELPQGNYVLVSRLKNYVGLKHYNVGIDHEKMVRMVIRMEKGGEF